MDDRELVDGIMNKEEHALECLLDRYGGLLKAITAYHLDVSLREDCMNEVLFIVWNEIHQYNPNKNTLKNWIGAVCKYKCIDYKRKYYKEHYEELDETIPDKKTPEKEILRREMEQETEELLACLSPSDREIFRRRYIEEETIKEISAGMKLSPSVLYNRLSKVKKKLRKSLRRCHDEERV